MACDEIDKSAKPITNSVQHAAPKDEIASSIPESNGMMTEFETVKVRLN